MLLAVKQLYTDLLKIHIIERHVGLVNYNAEQI